MVTLWRLETHMVYCLWEYYPELTLLAEKQLFRTNFTA